MQNLMEVKIKEFLIEKIQPAFIMIFGSYAKGYVHKDSDIDIAFYSTDQAPDSYELFMMAQELADILKIEVDLVDLRAASTVFQAQIYTTGKVVYSIDDNILRNAEMLALSMYAKLNEERSDILSKVEESRTIYEE